MGGEERERMKRREERERVRIKERNERARERIKKMEEREQERDKRRGVNKEDGKVGIDMCVVKYMSLTYIQISISQAL